MSTNFSFTILGVVLNFSLPVLLVGVFWFFATFVLADEDDFVTVARMRRFHRKEYGIPLLYADNFWGEIILIVPTLAYFVAMYGSQWSFSNIVTSALGSVILATLIIPGWMAGAKNGMPECFTYDGKLPSAGISHSVFFWAALTFFGLIFIFSNITKPEFYAVSVILILQTFISTHAPLHWLAPDVYPENPLKKLSSWVMLGAICVLLVARYLFF